MAKINKTRNKRNFLKKSMGVSTADFGHADVAGTDDLAFFNLPGDIIVTAAHLIVHEAGDALATADLGITLGGAELLNDADLATVGVETDALTAPLHVPTGAEVTLRPSGALTQGRFTVVVEYVEYNLADGSQTLITEGA